MSEIITEVNNARKDIKSDFYNMSVGEISNLYKEKEIILNPAYQRLYRWNDEQKTNFVESLILGFPIPPIFVAQQQDGTWDLVDGVQRISTVLQMMGILQGYSPLKLTSCKYIPSMEECTWDTLPMEVKRLIKRARLSVNIILTENSITAQYEVFQRLNTGGLHLSDQEIRNCLIIMSDETFYDAVNEFKATESFVSLTPITKDKFKEEYRMELIIRYLVAKARKTDFENYKLHKTHVRDFLDAESLKLINDSDYSVNEELTLLNNILTRLYEIVGEELFRKYSAEKGRFEGKFSLQVFEAILPGIASNFDLIKTKSKEEIFEIIKDICTQGKYIEATKRGQKALIRYKLLTELSYEYFDALGLPT
tara:strand:- start:1946 stop:3043 length:1098 start_codon:yes stop_codon:yes gene_type:complete